MRQEQADGSQLGYDEIGLPAVYGVFFAMYLIGELFAVVYLLVIT
jgi:hypothetical protein